MSLTIVLAPSRGRRQDRQKRQALRWLSTGYAGGTLANSAQVRLAFS
jgi:hypothetical protein